MTGVLYGRVSTNFVRQGNSIELQDEKLRRYCEWKQIDVVEVYHEEESGSVPFLERRMGAMLWRDWLGCGRAQHLVLTTVDRLGRNAADMLAFFDLCQKAGVNVHLVDMGGTIDFSEPSGRLCIQIMALFAENERLRIVGRIRNTLRQKRERGELIGKPPYGWIAVGTGEFKDRGGRRIEIRRLEAQPDEQLWLRWMVDLRLAGASYRQIADQLNAQKVPPKITAGTIINLGGGRTTAARGRWTQSGVESVLTNSYTREAHRDFAQVMKGRRV